MSKLHTF